MQILMKETRRGSEDGFAVKQYHKGESYDVAHTMGAAFINAGWAEKAQQGAR